MKTVAIVGTSETSRELAPYLNKEIDIWMFNSQLLSDWAKDKRCTAILELHQPETFLFMETEYTKWLRENKDIPVYMLDAIPEAAASVKYPLDEIVNKYLIDFRRGNPFAIQDDVIQYFTSTVCYAIALAIYQGYDRIELYGVDMANNTEYIYQRDGIGLWFGIALGLGRQVYIPRDCFMFNSPRYGYDDKTDVFTREEFERIASELQPMIQEQHGKLKT